MLTLTLTQAGVLALLVPARPGPPTAPRSSNSLSTT
jgi:hypothetical protein